MAYASKIVAESLRTNREVAFERLYEEAFPAVASLVQSLGGSQLDAEDVFQDALIVLYEKVTGQPEAIESSVNSYLLGIVKHLWIRKFREDRRFISMNRIETEIKIPEDFYQPEDANVRLADYLAMAGKKCMTLLEAFYYKGKSLKEIATAFGFSGIRSATVQKFKCLEKVRKQVKDKNLHYENIIA